MKKISSEQIANILQVIYVTNISAQTFDAVKKLFFDLPTIEEVDKLDKETKV
jgi:hypothetical protein